LAIYVWEQLVSLLPLQFHLLILFSSKQSKDVLSGEIYATSTTRGRKIRPTRNLKSDLKTAYQTYISNPAHWMLAKYVLGASNVCTERLSVGFLKIYKCIKH